MAAYLVTTPQGQRLVEARTGASALNFVIKNEVKVKTLNTSEVLKLVRDGMKIEAVPTETVAAAAE